jgi:periplasmic protein TonB
LSAYRLPSPYDETPLKRRLSGLGLALVINVGLILVLMTLGVLPPPSRKTMDGIVVNLIPEEHAPAPTRTRAEVQQVHVSKPIPKPPPVILPVKPTIAPPPAPPKTKDKPWLEMSSAEMAASDISKLSSAGTGGAGDSEVVGQGPNGEAMYAAEWARQPTDAELAGYLPRNAPDGYGLIACKTAPQNRVEDCIELENSPAGSHLASAVRQAAWQFRVRPPRKGGRPLIGSWVRIRIDYEHYTAGGRT